jgi:MFS family permease
MDKKRRNYYAFLWHALFLAFTSAFADKNTVLPGLILKAGGSAFHIGVLTTIMLAFPMLSQLIFAGYLSSRAFKKPFLLLGIYLRVIALGGVAWTLSVYNSMSPALVIMLVYGWMVIFSISGAFAGVSYNDILGKSIVGEVRKRFIVLKQAIRSAGILLSAVAARFLLAKLDYPGNYKTLFILASVFLAVAALGFWAIREKATENPMPRRNLFEIVRLIPSTLRADKNLVFFITISNLIGASVSLIPFYIAFAKSRIGLSDAMVGNYIFFHFGGMVLSNLLWNRVVKKHHFRGALASASVLGFVLPLLVIFFFNLFPEEYYQLIFILSGSAMSAFLIAAEGVLLEISNETNRSLYSGIFGAFNIVIAVYPMLAGVLVGLVGYTGIFIFAAALSLSALYFFPRLNCKHKV